MFIMQKFKSHENFGAKNWKDHFFMGLILLQNRENSVVSRNVVHNKKKRFCSFISKRETATIFFCKKKNHYTNQEILFFIGRGDSDDVINNKHQQ